jgi:hypothetical protein
MYKLNNWFCTSKMAKPDLPRGYLGAQPKFTDVGLSTLSHNDPEITLDTNEVSLILRCKALMMRNINLKFKWCESEGTNGSTRRFIYI